MHTYFAVNVYVESGVRENFSFVYEVESWIPWPYISDRVMNVCMEVACGRRTNWKQMSHRKTQIPSTSLWRQSTQKLQVWRKLVTFFPLCCIIRVPCIHDSTSRVVTSLAMYVFGPRDWLIIWCQILRWCVIFLRSILRFCLFVVRVSSRSLRSICVTSWRTHVSRQHVSSCFTRSDNGISFYDSPRNSQL